MGPSLSDRSESLGTGPLPNKPSSFIMSSFIFLRSLIFADLFSALSRRGIHKMILSCVSLKFSASNIKCYNYGAVFSCQNPKQGGQK